MLTSVWYQFPSDHRVWFCIPLGLGGWGSSFTHHEGTALSSGLGVLLYSPWGNCPGLGGVPGSSWPQCRSGCWSPRRMRSFSSFCFWRCRVCFASSSRSCCPFIPSPSPCVQNPIQIIRSNCRCFCCAWFTLAHCLLREGLCSMNSLQEKDLTNHNCCLSFPKVRKDNCRRRNLFCASLDWTQP